MSRAHPTSSRCIGCRMPVGQCLCDEIHPVVTRTRVILVVHRLEWQKTTTTSALLAAVLPSAEVRLRARRYTPFDADGLSDPARRTWLLFPSDDAPVLDAVLVAADPRPITLVVPDGSWRQARRGLSREEGLAALPRVRLPAGPPSTYRLRKTVHGADALSTAEAVARALAVIEDPAIAEHILRPLRTMVERTLRARGRSVSGTSGSRGPPG